MKYFILSVSI